MENIYLTAMTGQKINAQFTDGKVDLSNIPAGIYTAEIVLKNGQKIIKKIIKN